MHMNIIKTMEYNSEWAEWTEFANKAYNECDMPNKSETKFGAIFFSSQPTVNGWLSGAKGPPKSPKVINKFIEMYGIDVLKPMGLKNFQIPDPAVSIPMFGKIAAGMPIALPRSDFRLYDPESTITVLRQWLPANIDPAGLFALIVEGDSMKGEAIHDGDTLVMRKAETADNGDLVAVRLDEDDSVTLKKIYRENGTIRLQPANPKMKPIIVPAGSVHIEGKMVLLIRRMS